MKRVFEVTGSILTVVAAVAVLAHLGRTYYREFNAPEPAAPLAVGSRIQNTPALHLDRTKLVLLGTASTCRFCTASMPFYQRLTEVATGNGARVVAFTYEDLEVNRSYLSKHHVQVDSVVSTDESGLSLRSTPFLIVVDSAGTVVGSWQGQLNPQREDQVLKALSS